MMLLVYSFLKRVHVRKDSCPCTRLEYPVSVGSSQKLPSEPAPGLTCMKMGPWSVEGEDTCSDLQNSQERRVREERFIDDAAIC